MLQQSTNKIWNCDVGDPTLWTITNFLTAEQHGDDGVALTRQINQVVSLNRYSSEYFYNSTNLIGSPLGRTDQGVQRIGCAAATSVAAEEDFSCFIGWSVTGNYGVYFLKDFQIVKISHENIDRILNAESDITTAVGYFIRIRGHLFYIIRLSARTFCYDVFEKAWCEFTSYNGTTESNFEISHYGSTTKFLFGQKQADGTVVKFLQTNLSDITGAIKLQYTTNPFDMDNRHNKRARRIDVLVDKQTTTSPLLLEYTDDDYVTWRGGWTIDTANDRAYVANCGTFRKRALRVTHTANTDFRCTGFEITYSQGEH